MVALGRPQMTIWCMHFACWVTKATDTHSGYVILRLFHSNNGYVNELQWYIIRTFVKL